MGKVLNILGVSGLFLGIILLVVTVDRTDYVCPGTGCERGVPRPKQQLSKEQIMTRFKNANQIPGPRKKFRDEKRKQDEDIVKSSILGLFDLKEHHLKSADKGSTTSTISTTTIPQNTTTSTTTY